MMDDDELYDEGGNCNVHRGHCPTSARCWSPCEDELCGEDACDESRAQGAYNDAALSPQLGEGGVPPAPKTVLVIR